MLTQAEWHARGVLMRPDDIYIHKTDSGETTSMQDVDNWHRANGWLGAGYQDLTRRNPITGKVEVQQGRPDDVQGAAQWGDNDDSLGFAFAWRGNGLPPEDMLKAMEQCVVAHILREYKKGNHIPVSMIFGHRDVKRRFNLPEAATDCPGDGIYAWIYAKGGLRERVAAYLPAILCDWKAK